MPLHLVPRALTIGFSTQRPAGRVWLAALALLAGCASGPGGPRLTERRELPTVSDQTDLDRRARIRLELAGGYFERGNFSTALDEVKLALQARPDLGEAHNLKGLIYGAMNEPGLAEDSFQRAIQLNGRDADARHNYGWFLCQQRRFADAEQQFAAALAVPGYPGQPRTLMAQGVCQARNGQWAPAEKTLTQAYELDPANPATAVNLAEVLYRRGELERARFYVRRVLAQDPQVGPATLWLALRIENKLGQASQVHSLGQQLKQRFPQAPETLLYDKGRFDE